MQIGDYVICRTKDAGVFAGVLSQRKEKEVTLLQARRLWYWSGAASLSELAMHGVADPEGCKFPCEVKEILVFDTIELAVATEKARQSIKNVPVWSAFKNGGN